MEVENVPGVPATITISGSDGLRPESLTSFEFGYFGAWGPLVDVQPGDLIDVDPKHESHQFEAGVSAFYNIVDDLISFQSDAADPLRVLPVNQNDEEAYGFELEGRYVFSDSFSARANYSLAERRDRETGARNLLAPLQTLSAGVAYSGHGFSAMLWANYNDSTELDGIPIDSYFLVNGSISYRFPVASGSTGQVFVRFFNLLDDDHREHPQGDEYGLIFTAGLQFDW
jgi:outer membrane receptor protein involved in Fe transport